MTTTTPKRSFLHPQTNMYNLLIERNITRNAKYNLREQANPQENVITKIKIKNNFLIIQFLNVASSYSIYTRYNKLIATM